MIAWLAYRLADLVVRVLPPRLADRACVGIARLAFHAGLPARRAQEANLARLFAGASRRTIEERARESFEHFALGLSDFLRLSSIGPGALRSAVELRGAPHFEAARASGRGVILLSAHLGNWEWGAAWLAAQGERVHVVARPHANPRVETLFRRRRDICGVGMLPAHAPWGAAARALRRGEWVAIMADRSSEGRRGSVCAFAAALARRTGALVLPAFMVRLPGRRHAACFESPLDFGSGRAGPESRPAGESLGAILRRTVRRHPEQWCAFEPAAEALA